jgi:hypothetical protein
VDQREQEKRRDERIFTALPVKLETATGITRDVSASGVFFETEVTYALGSEISFAVELGTPGGRMVLKCEGEIVRIERRDARVGVAVKIVESTLEPAIAL